jgi:thiol-disulfide isomerase/thioredoxin
MGSSGDHFMEFGMRCNGWRFRSMKVLAICLCLVQLIGGALGATPGEVPVGSLLPEAQLNGLVGSPGKLSSFRGKPLLINVWASWCGPCREEMGSIERLNRRFGGKAFNVVGISTDDDYAAAAKFVKVSGVSFPNYIDRNLVLENMLGANRLPLTVLVDDEGRVIKKIAGSRAWDSPEAINLITQAFRLKAQ